MNTEQLIKRINELAALSKSRDLTLEEFDERIVLRRRYINAFKTSLRSQLDAIEIVDNNNEK